MGRGIQTILLVDDEDWQLEAMRDGLDSAGYDVLVAANYEEAKSIYLNEQGRINLLVIDVALPGGNGYELAKTLLEIQPKLRVIFISGHAGAGMRRFYGMTDRDVRLLVKPFEISDLLQRVRYVLEVSEPLFGGATA